MFVFIERICARRQTNGAQAANVSMRSAWPDCAHKSLRNCWLGWITRILCPGAVLILGTIGAFVAVDKLHGYSARAHSSDLSVLINLYRTDRAGSTAYNVHTETEETASRILRAAARTDL